MKETIKTHCCLCVFFLLQVTGFLTADRKVKSGRSWARSNLFLYFSCGDAWTHTPPVAVARGEDAPPVFQNCSRGLFVCNFQTLPCIFRLLVFDLFWTFDFLEYVQVMCEFSIVKKVMLVCVVVFSFMYIFF
jgi:hypothetical protein